MKNVAFVWEIVMHSWVFLTVCTDGAVRLSGGLTESEGTVEIFSDNFWGLGVSVLKVHMYN